jgi:hypothetical protein
LFDLPNLSVGFSCPIWRFSVTSKPPIDQDELTMSCHWAGSYEIDMFNGGQTSIARSRGIEWLRIRRPLIAKIAQPLQPIIAIKRASLTPRSLPQDQVGEKRIRKAAIRG